LDLFPALNDPFVFATVCASCDRPWGE
jgi:hypothetical protein